MLKTWLVRLLHHILTVKFLHIGLTALTILIALTVAVASLERYVEVSLWAGKPDMGWGFRYNGYRAGSLGGCTGG